MKKTFVVVIGIVLSISISVYAKFSNEFSLDCYKISIKNEIEEKEVVNENFYSESVESQKSPKPQITGIENGGIYNKGQRFNYSVNKSGVKKFSKKFYGDLKLGIYVKDDGINLYVLREPLNIVEYEFCRKSDQSVNNIKSRIPKIIFNKQDCNENEFYVMAKDINNQIYKSNIVSVNNSDLNEINEYLNEEAELELSKSGKYEIKVEDNDNNITVYNVEIR